VESAGDGNDIFWGWLDATGRIGIQAGNTAGAKSANPINDGQWRHVALTRDAATGRVEVYVDGQPSGSATSDVGVKTTAFRTVGRIDDTGGTPTYFQGAVDDLLIFNRVLTADEVRALA
jgi:MSHA biogenesis protein MshQ